MKKYILLCAGILFTIISNAQSVKYGLTLGANFTKVDGNGIKSSYYPGFIGGGFARIPLSEKWQLEPEVFVNFAHTKKADNFLELYNYNGYANSDESIKLTYVSIPVLVGYKVSKLITIDAGPQCNILAYDNEDLLQNNKKAFKPADLSATAGVELNLTGVRVFADYALGVTNVNNIDERYKWYNRQAYIGFNFNIL